MSAAVPVLASGVSRDEAGEGGRDDVDVEAADPAWRAAQLALLPSRARVLSASSSSSDDQRLEALVAVRRLLSVEVEPPISEVIAAGMVPDLVRLLARDDNVRVQFEAAWAVTNIASGSSDHTDKVVESGAVPVFVRLLSSPEDPIREQAGWALGNIAGDSPACQALCIDCGSVTALCDVLNKSSNTSTLRNCCWALTNMCRGDPGPPFASVKGCLPTLHTLVAHDDDHVRTDAAWAVSYLSAFTNDRVQAIVESGIVPQLVALLGGPMAPLVPALRTTGNIASGTDAQAQAALSSGALEALVALSKHKKKGVRRESMWALSNIAAGTMSQVQDMLRSGAVASAVNAVNRDSAEVQEEAVWVLCNITGAQYASHIESLAKQGGVEALGRRLVAVAHDLPPAANANGGAEGPATTRSDDTKDGGESGSNSSTTQLLAILEAFHNCFVATSGQQRSALKDSVDDTGALAAIERLQDHPNEEVYAKAIRLLEGHFVTNVVVEGDGDYAPPTEGGDAAGTGGACGAGAGVGFSGVGKRSAVDIATATTERNSEIASILRKGSAQTRRPTSFGQAGALKRGGLGGPRMSATRGRR